MRNSEFVKRIRHLWKHKNIIYINITGDGVAERTKASVATCTYAGSKPRPRVAFPPPGQIPTGAH